MLQQCGPTMSVHSVATRRVEAQAWQPMYGRGGPWDKAAGAKALNVVGMRACMLVEPQGWQA
jgi:hypothetical protein